MNSVSPANEVLTDAELYKKCREIGGLSRKYRNQFLGMLPEVMRRKLYLRHGMVSIYEFAAKLACISRETVNEVLRIHQHLEATPLLKEKLVSGEIGYTKLRAVATVVQPETQELWLEKVESMSKPTLEVYVRELKKQEGDGQRREEGTGILPVPSGLPGKEYEKPSLLRPALPERLGATIFVPFSVKVKPRTLAKMRVMKGRLEKKLKKPMNWNEAFEEMLKMLNEKKPKQRSQKKANTRAILPQAVEIAPAELEAGISAKRYIPAAIRHEVTNKNQGICHFPFCTKPGKIFHHLNRFALDPRHESSTIVSLCKPHEQIAHQTLIQNEAGPSENWQVAITPNRKDPANAAKYFIDQLVQKYRSQVKEVEIVQ